MIILFLNNLLAKLVFHWMFYATIRQSLRIYDSVYYFRKKSHIYFTRHQFGIITPDSTLAAVPPCVNDHRAIDLIHTARENDGKWSSSGHVTRLYTEQ